MQKIIFISLTFLGTIFSAETGILQLKRDIRKAVQTGDMELLTKYAADNELNPVNLDNCRGYKMLAVASGFGQEDVVKFLIDNGADVNAINYVRPGSFTALDVAEIYKHKVIVTLLKKHGAKSFADLARSGLAEN
jgi:hypothetical protein